MAVTLGSTGITFPDATTQTTAASGGGALQVTLTAASAITAGQTVQYTTGTSVEAVAGTVYSQSAGSSNTVLASSTTNGINVCAYDPNTTGSFVVSGVVKSGSPYTLKLQAGTTSSGTTTVGSVVSVNLAGTSGAGVEDIKIMFDPVTAGKGMVMLIDKSGGGTPLKAYIFTVSGTTVTVQSTTTVLASSSSVGFTFTYYGQDRFVFGFETLAYACSISTYTITVGAATSITTAAGNRVDMDYSRLTTNLLGYVYRNTGNDDLYLVMFTVNPTTRVITAGSPNNVITGTFAGGSIAFDPLVSTRLAVSAFAGGSSAVRVTGVSFSGTTIGSSASWLNVSAGGTIQRSYVKFLPIGDGTANNSVICVYYSYRVLCCCTTPIEFRSGITSGTAYNSTPTWQGVTTITSNSSGDHGPMDWVSGQTNKVSLPWASSSTSGLLNLASATVTDTNLTPANVIGIANASASAAASVVVNTFGSVVTNQTGLTAQSNYYVDPTGTLTTSSTSPNVSMGKALSSTSLLLKALTV